MPVELSSIMHCDIPEPRPYPQICEREKHSVGDRDHRGHVEEPFIRHEAEHLFGRAPQALTRAALARRLAGRKEDEQQYRD